MINSKLDAFNDIKLRMQTKMNFFVFLILVLQITFSCVNKETPEEDNVIYTCSMDPQVREHHPGKCPICHMELTRVYDTPDANDNSIHISDAEKQLANIKTEYVETQTLGNEKNLPATVMVNQNLSSTISSKISGRIERLFFKTIGEKINKGQVLYEIYSEQLVAAQKDFLISLQMAGSGSSNDLKYGQLVESSKQKLLLWGMSPQQINKLEKEREVKNVISIFSERSGIIADILKREGDYAMEGDNIFKLSDISSVWVEAQIYASEARSLSDVAEGEVSFPSITDSIIKAQINFAYPELLPNSKIIILRIEIQNPNQVIKPGMQAIITIRSDRRDALAVPATAIINGTYGDLAWIKKSPKVYEPRLVKTGIRNKKYIEILSGLEEGDDVVISGSYLLQSEYIFKKGISPVAGMPDMKKMDSIKRQNDSDTL